jgi:Domain of unknown function (DUF5050)/Phosphatidylinositol-specific phospholipase C, X domain
MAQLLDPNCSENFAVWGNHVYFQAGSKGLYRVPCDGSEPAKNLDENAGYLVVPGDSYVYFQAGSKGLYRVPCDGSAPAQQLDPNAGHLAVKDDYVYFQAGSKGLYRVPCNGEESAKKLDDNAGPLAVRGKHVYFQAGSKGLYRVPCDGSKPAQQLDPNCERFVVPGDHYVYFQAGSKGLYRVLENGSAPAQQLDPNAGHLVVPGDGYVYFEAGSKGLYRIKCDGSEPAQNLDPNAGNLVVFGDDYVYFQAGSKGLYRVPCNGAAPATQLDPNCGNLVASEGYIYFQGGPDWDALYRVGVAIPSAPAGLHFRIQDEYVVNTIFDASINSKYNAIENLLTEAGADPTDTWFLNFTSGASTGAYPNAVAGRINDPVKNKIAALATNKQDRLGTIVMDFPEKDLISTIFNYNSAAPLTAKDWMRDLDDQKKLSEITIPGTHDTCAIKASAISKCQNMSLTEQLEAGIRFIDIRCRHYFDKFELHHGAEYLGMDFTQVLDDCRSFLNGHTGECIVMSVKEEYDAAGNTQTFEERFMGYVASDNGLWELGNTIKTLGQVRQRIVLVRRFYIAPDSPADQRGIDLTGWIDNATFSWPYK